MVAETNMFNKVAGEGQEYILGNFAVTFIEDTSGADEPLEISSTSFDYSTTDYSIQDLPSIVDPEPALDLVLYEGATGSGWLAFLAAKGEEIPRAVLNDTVWFNLQCESRVEITKFSRAFIIFDNIPIQSIAMLVCFAESRFVILLPGYYATASQRSSCYPAINSHSQKWGLDVKTCSF